MIELEPVSVRFPTRSSNDRKGALLQAGLTAYARFESSRPRNSTSLLTEPPSVTIVPHHERPIGNLRHLPGDYQLAPRWLRPSFLAPR
jgi:hypothetical protein